MGDPPLTAFTAAGDRPPGDTLTGALTNGADHTLASRFRVYRLLASGKGIPNAADILHLSRQIVHRHALALMKMGALRRLSVPKAPLVCERGPRASDFERGRPLSTTKGVGPKAGDGFRAHAWTWRWRFTEGPLVEPTWDGTPWKASGVRNRHLWFDIAGERWYVREVAGAKSSSLLVSPPPAYAWDPGELSKVIADRGREVAGVVRGFAKRHGYVLAGGMERVIDPEFALLVPGLVPVGSPGMTRVHVDASEGAPELETRALDVVAAVQDLPRRNDEVGRRLNALESRLDGITETDLRVLTLLEKIVVVQAQASRIHEAALVASEPPRPSMGREGPEVA
ncbi:MAG: hypothetical protein ACYDDF_05390 [Thermoplasmatota archaeon]